ncbi:unnamed protein product [Urochloa humidicola]
MHFSNHNREFLSPQLVTKEFLHLNAYWAKLERNLGKGLATACLVWENIINRSGTVLGVWQQYISMEIEMGHIHEARLLYKCCYSKKIEIVEMTNLQKELEFYRWEGNLSQLQQNVRDKLNQIASAWSHEERDRCLDEMEKSFVCSVDPHSHMFN